MALEGAAQASVERIRGAGDRLQPPPAVDVGDGGNLRAAAGADRVDAITLYSSTNERKPRYCVRGV